MDEEDDRGVLGLKRLWRFLLHSILGTALHPVWLWLWGAIVSAAAGLGAWWAGLDRGWIIGAAFGFAFCLLMLVFSAVTRATQRKRAELNAWKDRCAEAEAALLIARAEAEATLQAARAEAIEEKKRRDAAIAIVGIYRQLKQAPTDEERDRLLKHIHFMGRTFNDLLDDGRRDRNHTLARAHSIILTVCAEKQPTENLEAPVREIANQFGLGDLV